MTMSKKVPKEIATHILNCLPSPTPEKNWGIDVALAAGVHTPAAIPSSKDLREAWWGIGDQGSTGSCVGWGTAEGVLRWHFVKAGKLNQKDPLSSRYVWMAAKETDGYDARPTSFIEQDGTWLKAALDVARKFGVVTSSVLPFQNLAGPELYATGGENTFYALAAQRKIASYFNLGKNLADWRAWIANNGPILTRLDVDATWDNATATHGKLDTFDATHTRGGHCVALVGYTPDRFIVRNSWGNMWGDKGFAYASNKYATLAFTEAWGVHI
jgi:C1A family cysteine protease